MSNNANKNTHPVALDFKSTLYIGLHFSALPSLFGFAGDSASK